MVLVEKYEINNYYSQSDLENCYHFSFSPEEIEHLCHYSENPQILQSLKLFSKLNEDINALFYEIRQVKGNWDFKDRVLSGLFEELHEKLIAIRDVIKELHEEDDKREAGLSLDLTYVDSMRQSYESKTDRIQRRRFYLLNYLINEIIYDFIVIGYDRRISDGFTHRTLEKKIIKSDIRIQNVLTEYHDALLHTVNRYAHNGLKEIILREIRKKLEYLELPLVFEEEQINALFQYYTTPFERIKKCFKPSCGNTKFKLGMKPIWIAIDIPNGESITAYFFAYQPSRFISENQELEGFILLTKDELSDSYNDDFPKIFSESKRLNSIFKNIEKSELFENWFNHDNIKECLIQEATFSLVNHLINVEDSHDTKTRNLKEIDLPKTTESLKDELRKIRQYYGSCYDLEKVIDHIKNSELESLEASSYFEEEEKEIRRQLIKKLFPLEEANQEQEQQEIEKTNINHLYSGDDSEKEQDPKPEPEQKEKLT